MDKEEVEESVEKEVFEKRIVGENVYNTRGCTKKPSCSDSPLCRTRQMACCAQMHSYNWLEPISTMPSRDRFDMVEIRFKNTHKDFYKVQPKYLDQYEIGDIVVVEGSPGYDVGIICLKGELARIQFANKISEREKAPIKNVLRKASQEEVDKWNETIAIEKETQRRARVIAAELGLNMKINNVEYQGDNTKAVFYYTAEERVDFRSLIKRYAEEFKVRIEMKQIGARQEAGNIGGIGVCGRELCCVSFLKGFTSVNTQAARVQQVSLNPQKLAGQCGKLKCCLNFEYDVYAEIYKELPNTKIPIITKKGEAVCIKIDVLKKKMTYSYKEGGGFYELSADQVEEYLKANERGEEIEDLSPNVVEKPKVEEVSFQNVVGQDDLTRFDKPKKKKENRAQDKHQDKSQAKQQPKPQGKQQGKSQSKPNSKPISKPILKTAQDTLKVIIVFFAMFSLYSCSDSVLMNKSMDVADTTWYRSSTLDFDFDVTDTTKDYRVYFTLRHTKEYMYMNSFFYMYTSLPDKRETIDTIECILADPRGKWIGSGIGRYRTAEYLFKDKLRFPLCGSYKIRIKQAMREDPLREISAVGLKIMENK